MVTQELIATSIRGRDHAVQADVVRGAFESTGERGARASSADRRAGSHCGIHLRHPLGSRLPTGADPGRTEHEVPDEQPAKGDAVVKDPGAASGFDRVDRMAVSRGRVPASREPPAWRTQPAVVRPVSPRAAITSRRTDQRTYHGPPRCAVDRAAAATSPPAAHSRNLRILRLVHRLFLASRSPITGRSAMRLASDSVCAASSGAGHDGLTIPS